MENYLYGDIIEGKCVGKFQLGWTLEELKRNINFDYKLEDCHDTYCLEAYGIRFFLEKKDKILIQITVFDGFKGKFLGKVGIGSNLSDFKDILDWEYDEELLYSYHIYSILSNKYSGIKFTPEKAWDETTPLGHISVYKSNKT